MNSFNDGLKYGSKNLKRTEALITVPELKRLYLHGIETRDNEGVELSDATYQSYIDAAVSWMEHYLDIYIQETTVVEEKDYFGSDYVEWGFYQLNNIPVIAVDSLLVTYLRDGSGAPETALTIPPNWFRLRPHDGLLRLVPNNSFPAQLAIDSGGSFFPELFRRYSTVPQLWTITYRAGFPDGCVPALINLAIGHLAAIFALNNSADLILGQGIASQSLSLDGLSQSIGSTSSAENTNNSAKVKEYYKVLFGETINSPNRGIMRILKDYWSSESINII
jgi:hypothetical protein